MIKSTPHAHTTFVDGKSSAEEMVKEAIDRGFLSLGFSEHAKQRIDPAYCLSPADEPLYIAEIKRLKEKYQGQIRIYLGIERDLYSTADRMLYDYVIAASHYFLCGDEVFPVDGRAEDVEKNLQTFFGGNGQKMARAYYEQYAAYVEEFEPDIIAHFDLIKKNNAHNRLFDANSNEYLRIAQEAMERMIRGCDLMEVNTGGMARGYMDAPYPDVSILKKWRALGGRVIIGSDCHDKEKLDFGFDKAIEVIKAAGYTSAVALGTRQLFEEYPL